MRPQNRYRRRGTKLYRVSEPSSQDTFLCRCDNDQIATTLVRQLNTLTRLSRRQPPQSVRDPVRTLLQGLLDTFGPAIEQDEPIDGGDAVEYLVALYNDATAVLAPRKKPARRGHRPAHHRSLDGQ